MKDCEECGKKLGMLEGYRHPTMGKKHLLCSPCFDQVSDIVARWGEFVLSNSFNNGSSKKNSELKYKNIAQSINHRRNIIENIFAEKGILIRKK